MSSTNRGATRQPDDFYATPEWCTRAILPYLGLERDTAILEPGCGDGAIVRAVRGHCREAFIHGVELDPLRAEIAATHCNRVSVGDFLEWYSGPVVRYRYAIGNPPYALAQQFIAHSLIFCDEVCFLLRLNFLGSQKRAPFWREHPADVFVLPKRPSFTGKGTDSVEYAWFVFGPERQRRWQVLDLSEAA